jgi:hypothetical protein
VVTTSVILTMLVETDLRGGVVIGDHADDACLLDAIAESETQARQADRRKLRYALEWAHRHVVADDVAAAHWSDADLRDIEETIGGEGTPLVASACVPPFATALGLSAGAAMRLLSDALDLKHRLPRLHRRVETLHVAPWRARRIATMTNRLSAEAAAYVDERLAPVADSCGVTRIDREVTEALAKFDPTEVAQAEDEAKAAWGVTLQDHGLTWAGTSSLEIIGDTPTLTRFRDQLAAEAHALLDRSLPTEDQPTQGQRMIAALGAFSSSGSTSSDSTTMLYVHVPAEGAEDALATVEGHGPLSLPTLADWLTGAQARVIVRPVLDLSRANAVDQHDPPAWMRELVILRDPTCVHPYCDRPARGCDLDHIEPYVEMDDGGPPGQTRPENLAPLCRRHHRAKTHDGWSYCRNPDGSYTWTSPTRHTLVSDPRGIVSRC